MNLYYALHTLLAVVRAITLRSTQSGGVYIRTKDIFWRGGVERSGKRPPLIENEFIFRDKNCYHVILFIILSHRNDINSLYIRIGRLSWSLRSSTSQQYRTILRPVMNRHRVLVCHVVVTYG